jgi:hypothetical protein
MASIAEFLLDENFKNSIALKEGVLDLINLISDYFEEGTALYPEVLITNNSNEIFKTISHREIFIAEEELSARVFKNIIKLCAPLAIGSWIIFIDVGDKSLKYGLVNAEMTETSPSIYEQIVGSLKVEITDINIAYLKNIGGKAVELTGLKRRLIVSLSLEEIEASNHNVVQAISDEITKKCENVYRTQISTFLNKTIEEALKQGHGNLIGVISDEVWCEEFRSLFSDGVYLRNPIDLADLVIYTENEKTNESSYSLMAYSRVFSSMMNHDGIILINDKAKVLGYHLLINSINGTEGEQLVGGARLKAYQSMINSKRFSACLYKSQDGDSKIWIQ